MNKKMLNHLSLALAVGGMLFASTPINAFDSENHEDGFRVKGVYITDLLCDGTYIPEEELHYPLYLPDDGGQLLIFREQDNDRTMWIVNWKNSGNAAMVMSDADTIAGDDFQLIRTSRQTNESSWLPVAGEIGADGLNLEWTPPGRGEWRILLPLKQGMAPDEDGLTMTWKLSVKQPFCPTVELGVAMVHAPSWSAWTSGVGSYFHPFVYDGGTVKLRNFVSSSIKRVIYNPGAIIYYNGPDDPELWKDQPLGETMLPAPRKLLEEWVGKEKFDAMNWAYHPDRSSHATCATTEYLEGLFYDGTATAERAAMEYRIENCMVFVRAIRAQLESHLACAKEICVLLDQAETKHPQWRGTLEKLRSNFPYYFNLYQEKLPVMQQPEIVQNYFQQICAVADDKVMSEEEKEEAVKELGRKIRTIGGTQDDLSAETRMMIRNLRRRATRLAVNEEDKELREFLWKIRAIAGENIRIRMPHEGR